MEDVTVNKGESGPPDEAAELLLNIGSVVGPLPRLEDVSSTRTDSAYPYTPPDDPQPRYSTSPRVQSIPPHPATLSSLLSTDAGPSTPPPAEDPAPPKSTKSKRKRSAPNSADRRSTDPTRPPHWMGDDNTQIRCICGIEDDDGFTIQCEGCGAWEHGSCFGYMDESSAPDVYFCELCVPRPFDAVAAREQQLLSRAAPDPDINMPLEPPLDDISQPKDRPKPRSKPKRPRQPTVDADGQDSTKSGASVMGPPSIKPKRKPSAKPRTKPSMSGRESTPSMSFPFKEIATVDVEHEYFREAWRMEYTPITNNIASSKRARIAMAELFEEWRDADTEEASSSKRTIVDSSGLPSPTNTGATRLSPDHGFLTPGFDVLAPPIPPIFLTHPDLDSLAPSVTIKSINDHHSFLPLNYAEDDVGGGVYTRPAVYGVFMDDRIAIGAFVGEFRGSLIDCETYRKDPVNQYAGLGVPKPYVHSLGPPINLIVDARGYGNELRFVRNGCHPNVVLRPLLWRREGGEPKLRFGLFASRPIEKNEEIILAWEWDDSHVVHSIQHVVMSLLSIEGDHTLPETTLQHLANKYGSVLSHMFGTFTSCACRKSSHCAVHQMRLVASYRPPKVDVVRGKARLDFGELIGAVRGWRRKEIEVEESKRWNTLRGQEISVRDMRSRSKSVVPSETGVKAGESNAEAGLTDKELEQEVENGSAEENDGSPEDMDIDESPEVATPPVDLPPIEPSSSLSSLPTTEKTSAPSRRSQLGFVPENQEPALLDPLPENEEDDGDVSDATTATEPKSHFSDEEEAPKPRRKLADTKASVSLAKKQSKKGDKPVKAPGRKAARSKEPAAAEGKKDSISGSSRSAMVRRGRKVNRVASSASEDEGPTRKKPSRKVAETKSDALASSLFDDSVDKLARVPEQAVAPMTDAMKIEDVPAEVATEEFAPTEEARTELETVQPKEPTPPREPTPEPPKKVSLSDYLKNHKIRKDTHPTPTSKDKELPVVPETVEMPIENGPLPTVADVKPDIETINERPINLMEFLPSTGRPSGPGPTVPMPNGISHPYPVESPLSTAGFTPNMAPRTEYFPPQPQASSAFVPRQSSSFVPRQSVPEDPHLALPTAYVPRQNSVSSVGSAGPMEEAPRAPVSTYVPRQASYDDTPRYSMTPPKPSIPLPAESYTMMDRNQINTPPSGPRVPPTGPKAVQGPPTGPRGNWNPPASPAGNRPPDNQRSLSGGYGPSPGPPRGFAGPGRGRGGGFAGGERGYDRDEGFGRGGYGGYSGRGGPPFRGGRGPPR